MPRKETKDGLVTGSANYRKYRPAAPYTLCAIVRPKNIVNADIVRGKKRYQMSVLSSDHAPLGHPCWWEQADWPTLDSQPPEQVDLLIIGAGYTGLSGAIAAHDAGAKVAVIDAGQPGQGASTRNGVMVGAHPRLSWNELSNLFGDSVADGVFSEAAPSLEFVRNLIQTEGIDCDFQDTGRISLAWTEKQFENQRKTAEMVRQKTGIPCEIVEREHLSQEIATERYFGGMLIPSHAAVHPWKYHKGLLEAVLRREIPVCAHCPATAVERDGAAFMVKTPSGQVRADKVLLATNGYTHGPFRWFQKRVFPLPSYLIATEELPPNLIGHIAPGRRMMVETRARHSYFRVSPDGKRILYGGRASMRDIPLKTAATRLHQTMCQVWPELNDVKVTHAWTGNTGYSFNHMPSVGVQNGIHYAMGFSGSGTVMAPYLGAKAALQAIGDAKGETVYSQTQLQTHWLHQTRRPHFLKLADIWYRSVVDRKEGWASR